MNESAPPVFKEGFEVRDRARRYGLGIVLGSPERIGGQWHYKVRFEGGNTRKIPERHLEAVPEEGRSPEDLVLEGHFGSLEAFQRALSVARIRKEVDNRTTVYSFNAQRVQFQPHQYKPLLRFLDSEDRRLMIADEVGLGKTIEAGIILAELEARQGPDRVLVVCPSRLTEKWWEELNGKFAQDFEVWRAQEIRDYARNVWQNPGRSRMRAIVSLQSIRREEIRETLLDASESFDLLIVDESHHGRNRSTMTYTTFEALAAGSAAVLLLTATPIHLGSEDLFNQLRVLRPGEFRQPEVFAMALQRNEGVVKALARIRTRNPGELNQAAADIEEAFKGGLFRDEGMGLVNEIVARMRQQTPTDLRQWVDLERDVEKLHYLANILTRTRKREVQELAAQRRGKVVRVAWTSEEQELFRRLTGRSRGPAWPQQPCAFGLIQRERMAASSLVGTVCYRDHGRGLQDLRADLFDDDEDPTGDTDAPEMDFSLDAVREMHDSKLQKLLEILRGIDAEQPAAKVLVFTYFVGTSRYLEDVLSRLGWKTLRIAGDVPSTPGRPEKDERSRRVKAFRDDPSVRVMVSTEVGSEGLDFQFCSTVVNYDLPWNPMTVEQRIGRIDRFGQKADVLNVWNLVVEGTIEERILVRLYARIGIFERSIGPLETILGEAIAELRKDYFEGRLRPEESERRLEQTAAAIENRRRDMERLDQEADRLFGHEDFIRSELERIRRLGRYVTPNALLSVLGGYLARRHGQVRVVNEGEGIFSIRMPDALYQDVLTRVATKTSDISPLRRFTREGRYYFAVEGAVAYDRQDVDLINASHPLIQTALSVIQELLADPVNRTGTGLVRIQAEDVGIPEGVFLAASFRVHVTGIRERTLIETSAVRLQDGRLLDPELSERLLHLVLTEGEEAPGLGSAHAISKEAWDALEQSVAQRAQTLEERENKENELLAARRRARLQGEHDHQVSIIDAREATASERGTLSRLRPLLEGQRDKARARLEEGLRGIQGSSYVQASIEPDPVAVCLVETRLS